MTPQDVYPTLDLTDKDRTALANVDRAIAAGRELYAWWRQRESTGAFADQFELVRTANEPDVGIGFFDVAPLSTGPLRVMGVDQQLHYAFPGANTATLNANLREFILHYFMRVSQFSQPSAYYETDRLESVPFFRPFSWCADNRFVEQGFGYSQRFYQLRTGQRGRFPTRNQWRIVDLRHLQDRFDWLVVNVRILDFNLRFQPLGSQAPQAAVPIRENTYAILTPDFIVNEDRPEPGVAAAYGLAYSLLRIDDGPSLVAYGPGRFDAGFQLIRFRLGEDGTVRVRMVFVINRPERILNINFDPVRWSFAAADLMSFGLASRIFWPIRRLFEAFPIRLENFDPITNFVASADVLTNGLSRDLCVSMEHLEKYMLVQHFMQHYTMIVGALLTFGQTADWTDRSSVPEWAINGVSR